MKTSNLYSLNWQDIIKGLIVAVGGAVITVIQTTLASGSIIFDWKIIATVSASAGLSYLGKNFFTPAQTVIPAEKTDDTSATK